MSRIPQIDSIEELARFWDTHDLTDFEDELEEIKEPLFENNTQTLVRVLLLPEQASKLERIAQIKGIDQIELLREWVNEKLRVS